MAAQRVLELGTSSGYFTVWLGDAVQITGGHVLTLEIDPALTPSLVPIGAGRLLAVLDR
jgi:predicted O-methyltransferase YrrM